MCQDPWLPFEQLPKHRLEKNLTALRRRHPELHNLFKNRKPGCAVQVRAEHPPLFACRMQTPQGWVPVHGHGSSVAEEYKPQHDLVTMFWGSGGALLYLYQVGLGFPAFGNLQFLEENPERRMVIIQDELSPLLAGMALYDFRALFESDQVLWILGEDVRKRLLQRIISLRLEETLYYKVIAGSPLAVQPGIVPISEITETIRALHRKYHLSRSATLWSDLSRHYKEHNIFRIKRVLGIDFFPNKPGGWILKTALKAMKRLGLETNICEGSDKHDREVFKNHILHVLAETKPDLILTITVGSCDYLPDQAFEDLQVPRVTYLVDHELPLRGRFVDSDIVVAALSEMLVFFESYFGKKADFLPIVSQFETAGRPTRSLEVPVSFVGGITMPPTIAAGLRAHLEQLRPGLCALADNLSREIARCKRHLTIYEIVDQAVKDLDPPLSPHAKCSFQYLTRIQATLLYRRKLLFHLLPFQPWIFAGDSVDLEPSSPLRPFLKGRIDQDHLPDLYASSAINVNIHSIGNTHTPSNRVFNVSMANGFQLCDPLIELGDFYRVPEEIPVYHSPEDLVEKVNYYLNHPIERREAAELSRKRTKQSYTYHHWPHRFLSIIERHLREHFDQNGRLELPTPLVEYPLTSVDSNSE